MLIKNPLITPAMEIKAYPALKISANKKYFVKKPAIGGNPASDANNISSTIK